MSINYSSLIIKKGLDTENLKNLIFKFSTNLIVEFEDFNDFNLFHENTFNSYVNLKNKSIVILSNKLTNSEINKFSFSEKSFCFSKKEDDRICLTLLYKEN